MISAKIIAHSRCALTCKEIVTWELIYPRFIHSEFMTHRLFSRNAASSRAIPVAKMLEMVRENPAMPVRFGANQAGMQDKGVDHTDLVYVPELFQLKLGEGFSVHEATSFAMCSPQVAWQWAAERAADAAETFADAGYHKQVANRLIEPFQWMKTVMTATEHDNWFWLRDHTDADPTIHALASCMWGELQKSVPVKLNLGEWHVPYVSRLRDNDETLHYFSPKPGKADAGQMEQGVGLHDFDDLTIGEALAISSSCCAQVSYRRLDDSLEKAKDIFKKLIESKPCHASPTEHQATPMSLPKVGNLCPSVNLAGFPSSWEKGITHADRNDNLWSGNFKGWIQHRQLIPDNVCTNYVPATE